MHLKVTKHFMNTWMRKWGWDFVDLREAMREAYRAEKVSERKWEVLVRKKGGKKLVIVYEAEEDEVLVITGTEG